MVSVALINKYFIRNARILPFLTLVSSLMLICATCSQQGLFFFTCYQRSIAKLIEGPGRKYSFAQLDIH